MNTFKIHIDIPFINEYGLEVELYEFKDGKGNPLYSLTHDILEKLQREYLNNASFSLNVIAASERYAAVQVTLSDAYGRIVSEVADVNTSNLDSTENKNYQKAHPLVAAKISAFDACVRKFLNLPRIFDPEEFPELKEQILEAEERKLQEEEEKKREEAEKMATEESMITTDEEMPENTSMEDLSDTENLSSDNNEIVSPEDKNTNPYANSVFHKGKYAGKTCEEVWKIDPEYFNYVRKYHSYNYATKYADFIMAKENKNG